MTRCLTAAFAKEAELFLAKLPAEWDIVLWGWNFDATLCVRIMDGLRQAILSFDALAWERFA